MISLKDWMEVVEYKISEGSQYCWEVFGPNAYTMDSWNGDHDGHSSSITFDTKEQTVYMVEVHDYKNERSYRMINPDYKAAYDAEVASRGVDDVAYDGVEFTDLESDEDFLEKATAIVAGLDYDTRISIPLDLPKDQLFEYMMAAHKRDITLNQFVEEALRHAMSEFERDPEGMKARAKEFLNE